VLVRELHSSGRDAGWKLATAVLVVTAAAVSAVTIVAELLLVLLWWLIDSAETRLLLGLTAALFPYQIFICVAAQAAAVLHAYNRFTFAALLPIVGNAVWLLALAIAVARCETDVSRVYALAVGVVAAGATQCLLTFPALRWLGFQFRWDWPAVHPRVREIAVTLLPVLLGLSIIELNSLADGLFAWLLTAPADLPHPHRLRYPLDPGTAAALYLGQRLYQFPLGVFGAALGTVLFPRFARHAAAGHQEELCDDLTLGLKLALAIGLPASAGLVVVARPLADALFRYGSFDDVDAARTASVVMAYGIGVWAFTALMIANRSFYAVGDRYSPLKIGLLTALLNLLLSLALAWPFGGPGLAIATAAAAAVQLALSLVALRRRDLSPHLAALAITAAKAAAATTVMTLAVLVLRDLFDWSALPAGRVWALAVPVAGGLAAYSAIAWWIGLNELRLLIPRLPRRVW
jgi:putative peptidoglycan lipid II flippase